MPAMAQYQAVRLNLIHCYRGQARLPHRMCSSERGFISRDNDACSCDAHRHGRDLGGHRGSSDDHHGRDRGNGGCRDHFRYPCSCLARRPRHRRLRSRSVHRCCRQRCALRRYRRLRPVRHQWRLRHGYVCRRRLHYRLRRRGPRRWSNRCCRPATGRQRNLEPHPMRRLHRLRWCRLPWLRH